ncbi:MAG: STM4504/CBY_0614 family protein [Mucilaginibacter sp.]
MAIEDLYSTRNKQVPEILTYESLPEKLKNQIVHIWSDFFNLIKNEDDYDKIWELIEGKIAKAHGKKTLIADSLIRYTDSYKVELYFLNNNDIEECLDVIEIIFRVINKAGEIYRMEQKSEEAVKELNGRFLLSGVGFQFGVEIIIKIDSKLLHQNIAKPVLNLLDSKIYENANEEYLNDHEHFRNKRNKECLNDCLKSFETTMKIICTINQWSFSPNDTASKLINHLIDNKFFPDYHSTHLNGIRQILESGVPTMRNKNGGHGQGVTRIIVTDEMASYMLNITGSAIKFLIEVQNSR